MTIEIQLTKGYVAIVDEIDGDLALLKWHINTGNTKLYARRQIQVNKKITIIHMHRLILQRVLGITLDKKDIVDHINGNSLDNTRNNLRLATNGENICNSKKSRRNTSGYKGVHFSKIKNRWIAQIQNQGKRIHLGYFDTPEVAHEAYCKAANEYYREFARFE